MSSVLLIVLLGQECVGLYHVSFSSSDIKNSTKRHLLQTVNETSNKHLECASHTVTGPSTEMPSQSLLLKQSSH